MESFSGRKEWSNLVNIAKRRSKSKSDSVCDLFSKESTGGLARALLLGWRAQKLECTEPRRNDELLWASLAMKFWCRFIHLTRLPCQTFVLVVSVLSYLVDQKFHMKPIGSFNTTGCLLKRQGWTQLVQESVSNERMIGNTFNSTSLRVWLGTGPLSNGFHENPQAPFVLHLL